MKNVVYNHSQRLPYPSHHTVGFVRSFGALQRLISELCRSGIVMQHIDTLYGREGLDMIDVRRDPDSAMNRLIRWTQKFWGSGEWLFFRQADFELRRGKYLLMVFTVGLDCKDRVADLMKRHGVTYIKYFNPMYVEHISSDTFTGPDFQRSAVYE